MTDIERLRLLIGDPMPFVHLAGMAAFAAFLVIFSLVFVVSFAFSLIWCGACRGRDVHAILPAEQREEWR